MTSKEYLSQIKKKNTMIDVWIREKESMWRQMRSLNSPQYDGLSVQSTKDPDRMGAMWAKIDAKERKINKEIDALVEEKQRIMREIEEIEDARFVEILLRRYVSFQKLEVIADEMHYTYDWMRRLHGLALLEFSRIHPHIHDL